MGRRPGSTLRTTLKNGAQQSAKHNEARLRREITGGNSPRGLCTGIVWPRPARLQGAALPSYVDRPRFAARREFAKVSIKGLNAKEKAAYLLGLAVIRQLESEAPDPDAGGWLNAVMRWAELWLTDDELAIISQETGLIFDEELAEILNADAQALPPPFNDNGDDIPF